MSSYSFNTQAGTLPNGIQKINQDSCICIEKFMSLDNVYFFGVFDGHGPIGDLVSNLAKINLPSIFL